MRSMGLDSGFSASTCFGAGEGGSGYKYRTSHPYPLPILLVNEWIWLFAVGTAFFPLHSVLSPLPKLGSSSSVALCHGAGRSWTNTQSGAGWCHHLLTLNITPHAHHGSSEEWCSVQRASCKQGSRCRESDGDGLGIFRLALFSVLPF